MRKCGSQMQTIPKVIIMTIMIDLLTKNKRSDPNKKKGNKHKEWLKHRTHGTTMNWQIKRGAHRLMHKEEQVNIGHR